MRAEADPTPPGAPGSDQTPLADPLVRPFERPAGPSLATTAPVRNPIGNSARTLLVLVVLLAIGVGVWWWRRPGDATEHLGGREWVITSVDGEPATNARGTVSTFVLDGAGEVRGVVACNVATGDWSYSEATARLDVTWTEQTSIACAADSDETYLPGDGDVDVEDGRLHVRGDVEFEAISLSDLEPAAPDEIAGSWRAGDHEVEIGARGLFEIDGSCRGHWSRVEPSPDGDGATPGVELDFEGLQRDDCELDPVWRDATPIVPVLHDGSLYLRRDRPIFPLDRSILRLDPVG